MAQLDVRFFAELNDFLPPERQHQRFMTLAVPRSSIKDAIEALGVPHPEVALILVNGAPVDFSYLVQPDDQIDVYPRAAALAVNPDALLLPAPEPRFILDVHLGRLAEYLRLLGFDTLYRNDYDDPELAQVAGREERILLTRDLGLLKRSLVLYGAYVRATDPQQQVIEVLGRFDFFDKIAPFRRCSRCNGLLQSVTKEEILAQLQPATQRQHDEFQRCQGCGQIYWKGSHFGRMQQFIARIQQHDPRATPGG
jgi:hypothetical protein